MIPAYRCASCGSPNVVKDTQTGGVKYNYLKGAIGTVALGVGGAVAGITSDTQEVFKCPDCGLTLTYSLGEPWKSLIDLGNSSIEARKNLKYDGIPVEWKFLKEKYPNIEEGTADLEIRREQEQKESLVESTKRNEADVIERVRNKLSSDRLYAKISKKDYISESDLNALFAIARYYAIIEYGGEYCVEYDGVSFKEDLLTLLEVIVGCKIKKPSLSGISEFVGIATAAKRWGYGIRSETRRDEDGISGIYWSVEEE